MQLPSRSPSFLAQIANWLTFGRSTGLTIIATGLLRNLKGQKISNPALLKLCRVYRVGMLPFPCKEGNMFIVKHINALYKDSP